VTCSLFCWDYVSIHWDIEVSCVSWLFWASGTYSMLDLTAAYNLLYVQTKDLISGKWRVITLDRWSFV